ncbi:MAG: hypothetical protein QF496_00380 [Dehalococcoidia bacterium]|jgi:hypothetical protein|nr:hypothetical protein [Dehalococcoidia bacterium]|tara:strand:- start:514 stop:1065 length:552 start_codon:yes stop_codon:yes gene_type:complete
MIRKKNFILYYLIITIIILTSCSSQKSDELFYEIITPSDKVFAFQDLKNIGFKKSREYNVSKLEGATGAWFGFWGEDEYNRKDYEIRFYSNHQDAVSLGETLAKEVTGKDAVIAKSEATWKEGVKDRRTIGGPGSGGGGRSGTFPKYGNYSIYGNMVILCEGQIEIALEVCWKLINTLEEKND